MIQKIGADKVQWAQHFIDRGFQGWWKLHRLHTVVLSLYVHVPSFCHALFPPALEPLLKQTAGKYCVGDEVRA